MKKYILTVLGLCLLICTASFASDVQSIDNDAWLDHVTRMQIMRENMLKLVSKEMPTAEDKAKLAELRQNFTAYQYDWDAYLKSVANSTDVTPAVGLPGCKTAKCGDKMSCSKTKAKKSCCKSEKKAHKCKSSKCADKKACCKNKAVKRSRNYNPKYGFCRKCGEVKKNCECKKEVHNCKDGKCSDKKACCKNKAHKCKDGKCSDKKACCKDKAHKCKDGKCSDKKACCKDKAHKCNDGKCADKKACCKDKAFKRSRNYNPKYGFCRKCGEVKKNCECKKEAMKSCKLCGNDYKNCICKKVMKKCSSSKACCKAKTVRKSKNYNPEYGFCRTCGEAKKNCECKK